MKFIYGWLLVWVQLNTATQTVTTATKERKKNYYGDYESEF